MFLHTLHIQNSGVDFLLSSDGETFVSLVQIDVLIFFLPANECLLVAPPDLLSKSRCPLLLQLLLIKNVCVTFWYCLNVNIYIQNKACLFNLPIWTFSSFGFWTLSLISVSNPTAATSLHLWVRFALRRQLASKQQPMPKFEKNCPFIKKICY